MPIYRSAEGTLVFHAEPPFSATADIGAFFLANGFERELWHDPESAGGVQRLPQHLHRALYAEIVEPERFAHAFLTVRHPLDRLLAVFDRVTGATGAPERAGLTDWLGRADEGLRKDAGWLGNALRPQTDFLSDALTVYRAEDGIGSWWAFGLAERAGVTFSAMPGRVAEDGAEARTLSDGEARALLAFARAHYGADFDSFGYAPEAAAALSAPSGRSLARRGEPGAVQFPVRSVAGPGRSGGAATAEGKAIPQSVAVRDGAAWFEARPGSATARVARRAVYAGPLFGAFGPFLLESLARLWVMDDDALRDAAIAWSVGEAADMVHTAAEGLRPYQREILDALGIGNEVVLVDRPTAFSELVMPEPGFEIPGYVHPDHLRFLERAGPTHAPEPGVKVWLSRSRLSLGEGRTFGIGGLERRLARAGWTVVHPQEMPWAAQVALLARAERVAGEEGSALHNLIFLRDAARLRVDILPRFDALRPNYETIARAKGFSQGALDAGQPVVLRRDGPRVWKWHPRLGRIADALR